MTIGRMGDIDEKSLYTDLLRCFRDNGHNVYTISPYEKRTGKQTEYRHVGDAHMLCVQTGNITKSKNLIEKGFATISLENIFIKGIKNYFADVRFDLVIYSTPPITFYKAIKYVKDRDGASSYLLLKDIFPQNAVDIGMMSKTGVKGLIYKYFRRKEKKLYAISDRIGCMSQANVDYVIKHNPEVNLEMVEVCPNCIEPTNMKVSTDVRNEMRNKYGLPLDKKIFVYGGNLGKPQGIPFLIECLKSQVKNEEAYFLIVGDGTEYGKLEDYIAESKQNNLKLMKRLPKKDYDRMVAACDVGLIFLDHRFTIPNFPSRLLSYMQAGLPVLACTDPNTDIGKVIVDGEFGWWCESNDVEGFDRVVEEAVGEVCGERCENMGNKAYSYMVENYTVKNAYKIITK